MEKLKRSLLKRGSVCEFFNTWIAQPASHDLPELPEFLVGTKVELRSQVLGCNVVAEVINSNRSLFIAESILAAFESFLATSLDSRLVPHQPNIRFRIVPSDSIAELLDFQIIEEGGETPGTLIEIQHSVNESYIVKRSRIPLKNGLLQYHQSQFIRPA